MPYYVLLYFDAKYFTGEVVCVYWLTKSW